MSLMSPGVNTISTVQRKRTLAQVFCLGARLELLLFPVPVESSLPRTEYNNDLQSVIPSAVGLSHIVFNPSLRTLFIEDTSSPSSTTSYDPIPAPTR